jgi:hypothetical protein
VSSVIDVWIDGSSSAKHGLTSWGCFAIISFVHSASWEITKLSIEKTHCNLRLKDNHLAEHYSNSGAIVRLESILPLSLAMA